jgi:hypothetical protein
VRRAIVSTMATTTAVVARRIIGTATSTGICRGIVSAAHCNTVIGTACLTDMARRIVATAALANMAGGIVGTLTCN